MADLSNLYSSGSAIADLRSQIKSRAETDFNEAINAIDTQASDNENLFGTIQKAGASITAVGAIGKGVLQNFSKLKAKFRKGDETSEDNPDAEADTEASSSGDIEMTGTTTETPYMTSEVDDVATTGGDLNADRAGDFGDEAEEADTDLIGPEEGLGEMDAPSFLESTGATRDIPEEATEEVAEDIGDTAEDAAGEIGGSITDTLSSIGSSISSTAGDALSSITSAASSAVSGAVDGASGAISGAVDAAGTAAATAAEAGAEAGGEAALGAGLEAAGAAADATGIGAIGGVILNIVGALVLGGSMTAGIVGDVESQNQQSEQTQQAQDNMQAQINAGYSNIAGRFAT